MTINTSNLETPTDIQLAYQRLLALERFKSGFLARTSHELRSPINTIVSLHQLILEDLCEDPEEERAFIGQSKDAALKMLALFDQITAVSKLDIGREPPKFENVDLSFLLPEVEMLTTLQAANQNIRYTVNSPTEEIEIYTDNRWLKNILTSLLQDAIPQTKLLSLRVEQANDTVTVVIECDRDAQALQTELDAISDITEFSEADDASDDDKIAAKASLMTNDDIKLSTGLILATAQTVLPLIEGEFVIAPAAEGAQLQCRFPAV
ncbi:MAG: histidine kinase dimerization/phospho-acceptor domain-containing protein [Cyanobacteria bacterium J06581_3]